MGIQVFPAASGGVTQKVQEFTSTGSFVTPSNVSAVEVFLVGGGGGGGGVHSRNNANYRACGGGGGGGGVIRRTISVTPGTTYTVTIGAGGSAGTTTAAGAVGSDTTFGALATAEGGGGGHSLHETNSTYYFGTVKATSGSPAGGEWYTNYGVSAAGGAGGNATMLSTYTASQSSILAYGMVATAATTPVNPSQGGYATGTANIIGGSGAIPAYPGPGIEGFGGGASSGISYYATGQAPNYNLPSGSIHGAGLPAIRTSEGSTAGNAGTANKGGGGSGAVAYSSGSGTTYGANGGAGGSGYARITYWS